MKLREARKIRIIQRDVQGEYDTLKACYKRFISNGSGEPERRIYSDCFLLHARNLIDFLCNKRVRESYCNKCGEKISKKEWKDDVLMIDFVRDEKHFEKINVVPIKAGVQSPYNRINKQLLHIDYSRLSDKQFNFFDEEEYYKKMFESIKKYFRIYNSIVLDKKYRIML